MNAMLSDQDMRSATDWLLTSQMVGIMPVSTILKKTLVGRVQDELGARATAPAIVKSLDGRGVRVSGAYVRRLLSQVRS